MSNIIINTKKNINYAISILKSSRLDINVNKIIHTVNKRETYVKIEDFCKKVNIPDKLFHIYNLLDSTEREFVYHNFIFCTFDEVINKYKIYLENKQDKVCDIAYCYHGMGYFVVLTMNTTNGYFFFRIDGGSNDYDRLYNWNFIKECNPENFKDKMYKIEDAFDIIKKEEVYDFKMYVN